MNINKYSLKTVGPSFTLFTVFLILLLSATSIVVATSEPEGPSDITTVNSTRRVAADPTALPAYAGNITQVTITGLTVTQSWQGFVGNVTGTITLDDAKGNTLYNWSVGDPEGEVYATTSSSVDWSDNYVVCWNWSVPTEATWTQLAELEGTDAVGVPAGIVGYGMAADDVDGIDETFSAPGATAYTSFYVGSHLLDGTDRTGGNACPVLKLYDEHGASDFTEVILYHNNTGGNHAIIYTALLESDVTGYDGQTWDFEMIVGEDGHDGDESTTDYYFYVELE